MWKPVDRLSSQRRRQIAGFLAIWACGATATLLRADPTPDQLKAMYDDSMRQLQQAQDRKNQLANENETLKAKIAELEGKLSTAVAAADPNYPTRARSATVEAFLVADPESAARFDAFKRSDWSWIALDGEADVIGADWPFRVAPPLPLYIAPPTTAPTTAPATTQLTTQAATAPTTTATTGPATTRTAR